MAEEYESARDFLNESARSSLKEKLNKKPASYQSQVGLMKQESVQYPFDNFDGYDKPSSGSGMRAKRPRANSGHKNARHSVGNSSSRSSNASFVSAADSMNDAKFDRLEWELRMKADRKNK